MLKIPSTALPEVYTVLLISTWHAFIMILFGRLYRNYCQLFCAGHKKKGKESTDLYQPIQYVEIDKTSQYQLLTSHQISGTFIYLLKSSKISAHNNIINLSI